MQEHGDPTTHTHATTTSQARRRKHQHRSPQRALLSRFPPALLDALPHAAILYANDGTVVATNEESKHLFAPAGPSMPVDTRAPFAARVVHFSPRSVDGVPLTALEWPVARLLRGEAIPAGEAVQMRVALPGRGDLVIACSGTSVRDDAGQMLGALLLATEVPTEDSDGPLAVTTTSEPSDLHTLVSTVFEVITDAILVLDAEGNVVRQNKAARTLFSDATDSDFFAHPFDERRQQLTLFAREGVPLAPEEWPGARVLRGETLAAAHTQDISYVNHEGKHLWLNASGVPLKDGDRTSGAVVVYRDVTEHRVAEQQTGAALEALLELAELVVQVPTENGHNAPPPHTTPGTTVGDLANGETHGETHSVLVEAAQRIADLTCRVLGCSRVGIVAIDPGTRKQRPIANVGLSPEQRQAWWAETEAQPSFGEDGDPELTARLEAGETLVIDMNAPPYNTYPNPYAITTFVAAPMRMGDKLVGILSLDHSGHEHIYTERDLQLIKAIARLGALVIERERLFTERAQAQADLFVAEEANRRMTAFLSMASHELRTPVTSILPNVEVLLRRTQQSMTGTGEQSERTVRLIERVHRQSLRLKHLVDDLLDVARIRADRLELALDRVDLVTLAREVVEELRGVHTDRTITLDVPGSPVEVRGDAMRLGQAITNFLTNALKYSPADQPIAIHVERDGEHARFRVRDYGPGIAPEEQTLIWEIFHRAPGDSSPRNGANLGLGLHITRTIIERHGGSYGVQSAPGEGSTFWFTLPLAPTGESSAANE